MAINIQSALEKVKVNMDEIRAKTDLKPSGENLQALVLLAAEMIGNRATDDEDLAQGLMIGQLLLVGYAEMVLKERKEKKGMH